jgi:ornithine carbamoyltransferase
MGNLQGRDLLSLADLQPSEIQDLLTLAKQLKAGETFG